MMKSAETVKAIVSLLEQLDGVQVLESDCNSNRMSILLTIESHKSHFWLEYCAEAANVHFNCCSRYYPWSEEAISNPAQALIYSFEMKNKSDYTVDFNSFNYLGSFLVWLMHRFDMIESEKANRLLDSWGSIHVEEKNQLIDKMNKNST